MNYYQKQKNLEIGEYVRQLRENAGHTQDTLSQVIYSIEESTMKNEGFSNDEIEENLKFISISTISRYENGTQLIPATYVELVKKICENR